MKKLLATLLAVVMLFSTFAVVSFAADENDTTNDVETVVDGNAIVDALGGLLADKADADGDGDFDADDIIIIIEKELQEKEEEEAAESAMIREIVFAVIKVVFALISNAFAA